MVGVRGVSAIPDNNGRIKDMKRLKKMLLSLAVCLLVVCTTGQMNVFADGDSPIDNLFNTMKQGAGDPKGKTYALVETDEAGNPTNNVIDYQRGTIAGKHYEKDSGGYYTYIELYGENASAPINEDKYNLLTKAARQEFLEDFFRDMQLVQTNKASSAVKDESTPTTQTCQELMKQVEVQTGASSQLLASLLANTRPDFVAANKIYKPFSGIVGTVLGLLSVLMMALLGVTMALDLAYIVVPMFRMVIDGDSDGGQGKAAQGMARIISQEAHSAVRAAEEGGGNNGQNGSGNKAAVTVYFKHRWKALLMLGVCLLYLFQGRIYSLISWIIDLMTGFLGI